MVGWGYFFFHFFFEAGGSLLTKKTHSKRSNKKKKGIFFFFTCHDLPHSPPTFPFLILAIASFLLFSFHFFDCVFAFFDVLFSVR